MFEMLKTMIIDIEKVADVEEPVVKPKRAYRSKFYYMSADEIKEHKANLRKASNLKYKENHYDKLKEAQKRFSSSEKGRDYQRDYKRKEAILKKEAKLKEVLDV